MNPLIRLKKTTPLFVVSFVSACFAFSSTARAVTPTPDGGYFGANTAEGGAAALFSLTTGTNNTALGSGALSSLTTGKQNTATGAQALKNNTADQNTADGFQALARNTTGSANTATGWRALVNNTEGGGNTATGYQALLNNTDGSANTAMGDVALQSNRDGFDNVAVGVAALLSNRDGNSDTAVGANAMSFSNADFNTAVGTRALNNNISGSRNVAIGYFAGGEFLTGSDNIDIGYLVDGQPDDEKTIRIGTVGFPTSQTRAFIAGIYGTTTGSTTTLPVIVDLNGQLGTAASSERFKKDVKPMDKASESILAVKPVTFRYKSDAKGTPQFGLIAEEVAKVNPDLVVRDKDGEIYTVRYDAVNAMLLNEFLKEHHKVEKQQGTIAEVKSNAAKQEATIARQQKQIEALSAGLQKVSAQLEASKPAPQVVNNP